MIKVLTLDKISPRGLELMPPDRYLVGPDVDTPEAILVRSRNILEMEFPPNLLAIGRAGAGVNNIPLDRCSEAGIVVFNTPGANANSVKELVIMGLILASRNVFGAVNWARSIADKSDEVRRLIEKGKSRYKGTEIRGKKLGVIGLGAIGVMVANDADALGMEVCGYDPFISIDSAWGLSRSVRKCVDLDVLLRDSDYVTLHVPLTPKTKGLLSREKLALLKKGAVILNFARGGLIENAGLRETLESGAARAYVTDFPDAEVLAMPNVIPIPHLGASTLEAEENCAQMAVRQLMNFFEQGNIKNSVNLPDCELHPSGAMRLTIINRNIPNMIGQMTPILAHQEINIANMLNRSLGQYAYTIIDVDSVASPDLIDMLEGIDGVLGVRTIPLA